MSSLFKERSIKHTNKQYAHVFYAEFSSDGTKIITASTDHTVIVTNLINGGDRAILNNDNVTYASFSPNEKEVVIVSESAENYKAVDLKITNLINGTKRLVLQNYESINPIVFSPDKKKILTISSYKNNTVKVLDLYNNNVRPIIYDKDTEVTFGAFSPDGKKVITAERNRSEWQLKVTNLMSDEEQVIKVDKEVTSAVFSPDGNKVLTLFKNKTAEVMNLTSMKRFAVVPNFTYSASFSPDGEKVMIGRDRYDDMSTRSEVYVLDISNDEGRYQGKVECVRGISSAAFSPDGKKVLILCKSHVADNSIPFSRQVLGGEAIIADCSKLKNEIPVYIRGNTDDSTAHRHINFAKFSPDGESVITLYSDNATIIDLSGNTKKIIKSGGSYAAFSPDGKKVLTTAGSNTAFVTDLTE